MSFLDKAKTQANNIINNTNKGGSPMGNPFIKTNTVNTQGPATAPIANKTVPTPGAKPQVPGAKPQVPGVKPSVPGSKPSIPGVKPTVPGTKPSIPGVKPAVPVAPAPKKEEVVETVQETISSIPKGNPFAKPTAPTSVAPVEKVKEEIKEEIKEEVVEAVQEEIKEIAETVVNNEEEKKEETKTETKKAPAKKKGGSRKKATKSEEVKDTPENTIEEVAEIVIPKTTLSYADACQSIRSSFVDEEWDAKIAYFEEKKNSILISNDLNRAQLHDLLAQITTLRDEMYYVYIETKNLYEHLTDKENGLIEVTKKLHGKGSNTEERKVNGIVAVMNYKTESGDTVNLYELLAETRIRYNFLKGLNDSIEFKKMVLLTMLSSLKSN